MRVRLLQTLAAATVLVSAAAIAAPPPWAPAHGYRYRNLDGLELVYDAHHGLWEVLTIAGLYYLEGRYWRRAHDRWEWTDRPDGAWRRPHVGAEPPALRGWQPGAASRAPGSARGAGPQGHGAGKPHGAGRPR